MVPHPTDALMAAQSRAVRVFVARRGNAFMVDIATWIVEAARQAGREAWLEHDTVPVADGVVNLVVAPHEYYLLGGYDAAAVRRAAACSIPIATEQPGTAWFDRSLAYCAGSPLVVDINEVAASAIGRAGHRTHHLRLGAVPGMDRWTTDTSTAERERDIDVVFLGALTAHRAASLASMAPSLWDRACELRSFPVGRPIVGGEPGLVFGSEKYNLLARSRILLNLHRGSERDHYFEWARVVEAMANGCVVVSEPSVGHAPLVPGTHFVEADVGAMPAAITQLLDDETRRDTLARAAHTTVLGPLALRDSLEDVLAIAEAERIGLAPLRSSRRRRLTRAPIGPTRSDPLFPVYTPFRAARRAVYDAFVREVEHRREIGRLRARIEFGDDLHTVVEESASWASSTAEVTAVVTLFDYAHTVFDTLDSIAASVDVAVEIVVVDDASRDDGIDVVRRWMRQRPDVSVRLVMNTANRGLSTARNTGLRSARTELVMMIDADNLVYPTCLRRLADALHGDRDAAFAYSTLEAFGADPGLRSGFGWHLPWLCDAPYIDAQAMLRAPVVLELGGYRADPDSYGWEDWDLWLHLAAAGHYGRHVPQMLGRYRTHDASMVSITNLAADDLRETLIERYPELPWPEFS